MNYDSLCAPEKLQETYRLMLMTLEYGGSVNTHALNELEKKLNECRSQELKQLNS